MHVGMEKKGVKDSHLQFILACRQAVMEEEKGGEVRDSKEGEGRGNWERKTDRPVLPSSGRKGKTSRR